VEHSLALEGDDTVAAWGPDWYGQTSVLAGQTTVPAGLTCVTASAAGAHHSWRWRS
jgi:hypothetical protein